MQKTNRSVWMAVAMLVLASLACNMVARGDTAQPADPGQPAASGGQAAPAEQPAGEQPSGEQPQAPAQEVVPTAPQKPPEIPLGLRQGLASLDSYRFSFVSLSSGPNPADKSDMHYEVAYDSATDASWVHSESFSSDADDPDGSQDTSDRYQIKNKTCEISGSGEELDVAYEEVDPLLDEMTSIMSELLDMTVYVENPEFQGEETVNGIVSNHFRFKITRLGDESGAQVLANDGEYWVAVNGQYLVKYDVTLKTSSGTQSIHIEIHIELKDANQPVQILMPADCQ